MRKVLILFILLLPLSTYAKTADPDTLISQYFDKTIDELSGLTVSGVKPTKDWFDTHIFKPLKATIDRISTERNLKDYSDLQDAFDEGKNIYVPPTRFNITDSLSVMSGTYLHGVGDSSIIYLSKPDANPLNVLRISNKQNIIIHGLHIMMERDSTLGTEWDHGITIANCDNVIISNCIIENPNGDCINILSSRNVLIIGNTLIDSRYPSTKLIGRNPISIVTYQDKSVKVEHIRIMGNYIYGGDPAGIDIEPNDSSRVHDIVITGNTFRAPNAGRGISIEGGSDRDMQEIVVSNNAIYNYSYGLSLRGNSKWRNILINGNSIKNSLSYGLWIGDVQNCTITNNVIDSSGVTAIYYIGTGKNLTISNNIIRYSHQYGIEGAPGNSFENVIIKDNRVYDNNQAGGGTQRYGIWIDDGKRVLIDGNVCYDDQEVPTQSRGIAAHYIDTLVVANNWCYGNAVTDDIYYYGNSNQITFNNVAGLTLEQQTTQQNKILLVSEGADTLPAITSSQINGEITGNALEAGNSDYGLLRLSAGGGTNPNVKTAIDLHGYSTNLKNVIVFYVFGTEQARINGHGLLMKSPIYFDTLYTTYIDTNTAGDLLFRDQNAGLKTLSQLAASGSSADSNFVTITADTVIANDQANLKVAKIDSVGYLGVDPTFNHSIRYLPALNSGGHVFYGKNSAGVFKSALLLGPVAQSIYGNGVEKLKVDSTGTLAKDTLKIGDSNKWIWHDGGGNLQFHDGITGTKTLAQLASGSGGAADSDFVIVTADTLYARNRVKIHDDGVTTSANYTATANNGGHKFISRDASGNQKESLTLSATGQTLFYNGSTALTTVSQGAQVDSLVNFGNSALQIYKTTGGDLTFKDVNAGTKTLSQLAAGGASDSSFVKVTADTTVTDVLEFDGSNRKITGTGNITIPKFGALECDSLQVGAGRYIKQIGITTYGDSLFIVISPKHAGKDTVWLPLH